MDDGIDPAQRDTKVGWRPAATARALFAKKDVTAERVDLNEATRGRPGAHLVSGERSYRSTRPKPVALEARENRPPTDTKVSPTDTKV